MSNPFLWIWEAKNLNFRTFFNLFSMQKLEGVSEGQQIEQKTHKRWIRHLFGAGPAECAGPGEGFRKGVTGAPDQEL